MMNVIWPLLPLLCMAVAGVLLIILTLIDLRHFLLPDKYVFSFALCGLMFHASTGMILMSGTDMVLGALVGGGMLLAVRAVGNMYYKQESLGLGDVKLLAAAGLWLGPVSTTLAITVGAAAGLIHGIGIALGRKIRHGGPISMSRLILPAGPGFIVGIVTIFIYDYYNFISITLERLFS
jgi:leader peptidase (prepilin peptidase) / N-methyltransferase